MYDFVCVRYKGLWEVHTIFRISREIATPTDANQINFPSLVLDCFLRRGSVVVRRTCQFGEATHLLRRRRILLFSDCSEYRVSSWFYLRRYSFHQWLPPTVDAGPGCAELYLYWQSLIRSSAMCRARQLHRNLSRCAGYFPLLLKQPHRYRYRSRNRNVCRAWC